MSGYGGVFCGTNTPTLTVQVSTEACSEVGDFLYYCIVQDGKAGEGAVVTLRLGTVPEGKRFQEWEVISAAWR